MQPGYGYQPPPPVYGQQPGYSAPGYGAPGYGAPGYGAPGYGAPGYGAPGYGSPGYGAPGYGSPGYGSPPQGGFQGMMGRGPMGGALASGLVGGLVSGAMAMAGNMSGGTPAPWMAPIPPIPNCPAGLEYLAVLDSVVVRQNVELVEALVPWETSNTYNVFNKFGQKIYLAAEESNICCRQCCGSDRAFVIKMVDCQGNVCFQISRPFQCCVTSVQMCACFSMCQHKVKVEDRDGQLLGYVLQRCSYWYPHYEIRDAYETPVYEIWGPCWGQCLGQYDFEVKYHGTDQQVGVITKQWSGVLKEFFTDTDNFGVSFPLDMDVRHKAVLVGAVFLIDFMYYEDNTQSAAETGVQAHLARKMLQ